MTPTRFLLTMVSPAFMMHFNTWVRKDLVGVNVLLVDTVG